MRIALLSMVFGLFFLLKGVQLLGFGGNLVLTLIGMCFGLYCWRKADLPALARAERDERK